MRFLQRNKRSYYVSNASAEVDSYGNRTYKRPFLVKSNLVALGSESDIASYGERVRNMYKTVLPLSYLDKIKENDLAYIEKRASKEFLSGVDADYRVESVRRATVNTVRVVFEKLP